MATAGGVVVTLDLRATDPEAEREVERTLTEIMECVRTKDIDRLEAFHLYGPKFTKFDDFDPLDRQDADACRTGEREGIEGLDEADFSFRDLKVDVFGPLAVATFVLEQRMRAGDDDISADARSTIVFVRDGSAWKITHEHFSAFKSNP